jgi:hypothetical protein
MVCARQSAARTIQQLFCLAFANSNVDLRISRLSRPEPLPRCPRQSPPMTATGQFVLSPLSSAAAGYEEILGEAGCLSLNLGKLSIACAAVFLGRLRLGLDYGPSYRRSAYKLAARCVANYRHLRFSRLRPATDRQPISIMPRSISDRRFESAFSMPACPAAASA